MRLGVLLKRYRQSLDLGQRELAHQIGVSTATVCRIERGEPCDIRSFGRLLVWLTGDDAKKKSTSTSKSTATAKGESTPS